MKKIILTIMLCFCSLSQASAEEWSEYKGVHFIIYYKEAPKDFIKIVEEHAEGYYKSIARSLGFMRYKDWQIDERAKIYVYDDNEDYLKNAGAAAWSHGVASPKARTIKTYPSAHGFFDSTLPHELAHIIFREFVGFYKKIPPWFEEGVAMRQEKAKRYGAHKIVRRAIKDGTFAPLEDMNYWSMFSNANTKAVELYYSEAASIMAYMIDELGINRFQLFLRKLRESESFEEALKKSYSRFNDVSDINKAWLEFLKDG